MDPERGVPGGALLAPLFGAGADVFHRLHDVGLLPRHRLPVPVWSVGNLTVGGTGKTPVVLALAAAAHGGGLRVGILTRGYGGTARGILRQGEWVGLPPRGTAGDEALLLSRRLPGVPIVVGPDRVPGARRLLEREAMDLLLLDDGFQHRRLARDHDLVCLDAERPLGNGRRLPAGPLREGPRALRRADLLLATGTGTGPVSSAFRELAARYAPEVPILAVRTEPVGIRVLGTADIEAADGWRGRRVLAVSGIARPGRFHALLERLGCVLGGRAVYRDHHRFQAREIRELEQRALRDGLRLVTTAKDEVRLLPLSRGAPWYVAEIAARVDGGWDGLLERLGEDGERGGRG